MWPRVKSHKAVPESPLSNATSRRRLSSGSSCWWYRQHDFQHSETEPSQSLDLMHGTVCHTSSLTAHHLLLGNILRLFYFPCHSRARNTIAFGLCIAIAAYDALSYRPINFQLSFVLFLFWYPLTLNDLEEAFKLLVTVNLYVVDNYPRDAMLARVFAIATCLSVCPSVRPSVTRRYCA